MTKSRIAFICPSKSWGGLEMNVLRLSVWLNKRNRNILLYCTSNSKLYTQAKNNNIDIRELNSGSKFDDILKAPKLVQSFKKENVRVVLFHLNRNFPMMSLTKLLSGNYFKLIYMQHMHLGGKKKDLLHRFIYNQLDIWIAPLQMFAKKLTEITTIDNSNIEVIPFGIELEKFTNCSVTKTEARKSLQLPLDKIIVGFIGRLDPKKCQHLLIETAYKLKQKGINIDILLVGDSTKNEELQYKTELENLIDTNNLKNKIHFRSHIDNVEIAFKALDIFCLTTASETFGMVTIEAMASRLAVIGSNDGGTIEIIQHEKNGLLYDPENVDEIVLAIKKLLQNPKLKEKLANQAQVDSQNRYSHTVQCDSLEKCFDRLL